METRLFMSRGEKIFAVLNYIFLIIAAFLCLFPIINMLAISLSSASAASTGAVKLWPVNFTTASYVFMASKIEFWRAFLVTVKRIALALPLTLAIVILTAYPMSRTAKRFKGRNFYTYFFLVPMLFSGGLVPWYMTIRFLGLIDSIWALVLPGLVPVFSVILLMNFYRNLPQEIEEAAMIDGANNLQLLWHIYIPLSAAAIATIALFTFVGHWNSWFDGQILMNHTANYPLQSYLQGIIIVPDIKFVTVRDLARMQLISDRTTKAAQIFIGALPVLLIYPFLQRYFMSGIVLGSVKG